MTATQPRLRRLAARIRRVYAELYYAQRRMFELRTGVNSPPTWRHEARRVSVEELEALLELDYPGNADRV
jgi:hypothetical protein